MLASGNRGADEVDSDEAKGEDNLILVPPVPEQGRSEPDRECALPTPSLDLVLRLPSQPKEAEQAAVMATAQDPIKSSTRAVLSCPNFTAGRIIHRSFTLALLALAAVCCSRPAEAT